MGQVFPKTFTCCDIPGSASRMRNLHHDVAAQEPDQIHQSQSAKMHFASVESAQLAVSHCRCRRSRQKGRARGRRHANPRSRSLFPHWPFRFRSTFVRFAIPPSDTTYVVARPWPVQLYAEPTVEGKWRTAHYIPLSSLGSVECLY